MSAAELDELVRLYQRASSHLSTARTAHADVALDARLSRTVGRAHAAVYGSRVSSWRALGTFWAVTFPAAVWHARRAVLASFLLFTLAALAVGTWIATSEAAFEAALPAEAREAYLTEDFEAYYSSRPAAEFGAQVFTNNAQVGATAFATGIAFCVPTALILLLNGANVGFAGGLFHAAGEPGRFYALILPHGLLELTAVFVAGGAGLMLGWTLIAPGDRRRADALGEEGRRAVAIVIGLVGVFLVAGVIEAFVTPSGLPTWVRVGFGAAVEVGFLVWMWVGGRSAARAGRTGALGEERRRTGPLDVTAVPSP